MNERDYVLAKQAGFVEYELEDYTESGNDIRFSQFADLIRSDEREACAKVCDAHKEKENLFAEERYAAHWLAEAIRAKGNNV